MFLIKNIVKIVQTYYNTSAVVIKYLDLFDDNSTECQKINRR